MTGTPRLGLAYLVAAQAQKEVTHNEALNDLDALVHCAPISRSLAVAPGSPAEGDVYIVAASPTGAWSGQAGKIACYFSGWRFKTPKAGCLATVVSENKTFVYDGANWLVLGGFGVDATLSWTPGVLANGSGVTSGAVSVPAAALGDFVLVAAPYDLQGVMATAYVSAAGQVKIRLHNASGASVTLNAGTWRVRVVKG